MADLLPRQTYIICANYRSGSTLLSEALKHTGCAGYPEEYFIDRMMNQKYPQEWGLEPGDFPAYLARLLPEGTSPNGVFGLKIMYSDMRFLIDQLRLLAGDVTATEGDLLAAHFPNPRYIYIYRRDKLRQGISMVRSSQSEVWHQRRDKPEVVKHDQLRFDRERIDHDILQGLVRVELQWQWFFQANDIHPLVIIYEDFVADYENTLINVLKFLEVYEEGVNSIPDPPLAKMADDLTEAWVEQYMAENGWLADDALRKSVEGGEYSLALLAALDRERGKLMQTISHLQQQVAATEQAIETWEQRVHDPVGVRDFIPWGVLLRGLYLKLLKRVLRS